MTADARPLVVGLGNELRGDDSVGIEVVRRLRTQVGGSQLELLELQGEPVELLEHWRDRGAVVLVDAMRSGSPPGTIQRIDAGREPVTALAPAASSTHALGLAEVIELARALGRLPAKLTVYAVEGRSFHAGSPLSEEVSAAIARVSDLVRDESMR